MRAFRFGLLPIGLCLYGALACAEVGEPLYVKNLSPVAGLLGLPSQRAADIAAAGGFGLALHSSVASHYVAEQAGDELLNFDGETLRFALEARYAIADDWDLQLEFPWLRHSGGSLDSFIDDWHDFFGLSDGGRSRVPDDLLTYGYRGVDEFLLQEDSSGLGDVTLSLSHRFYHRAGSSVALALGYKFATGDEDDFLGSGSEDAYLLLRFSGDHGTDLPLRWHGQAGYLRAGRNELIAHIQERDLWFAGLALDWLLAQHWSLLAQLDAHSAVAQSAVGGLGEDAVLLTAGARWRPAPGWSLDLSVIEDVQVESAPDVTFQFSARYAPNP